jgi:NADH-quinone oxidoreductase subunit M
VPEPQDISRREFFAFGSLAALCLVLGLLPQPIIEPMKADVRVLSIIGDKARARTQDVPYVYVEDEPNPPAPAADPPPTMDGKGPLDGKGPPGGKKGGKGGGKKKDPPAPGAEE